MINEDLIILKRLKAEEEEKNINARVITEYIRPEIMFFAKAMEKTMRKHDGLKGDSWRTCDIFYLMEKLIEEKNEVENAFDNLIYHDFKDGGQFRGEIVDLANVCMMLRNRK